MTKHKSIVSGVVVAILVAANFVFAIRSEMHLFTHEVRNQMHGSISIAISGLQYGLPGYLGYNAVKNAIEVGFDEHTDPWFPVVIHINPLITNAMAIENVAQGGVHTLLAQEPGMVDFYKLSFLLFGFRYQSFLYFYFLILAVECLLFFLQFRKDGLLIALVVIFLTAHYITLTGIRFAGSQLDAPTNNRFLPVLAILPMLHICTVALQRKRVAALGALGLLAQSVLAAFIWQCRNTGLWVLFLAGAVAVYLAFNWALDIRRGRPKSSGKNSALRRRSVDLLVRTWPILLVFVSFVFAGWIYRVRLSDLYFSEKNSSKHTMWHNVFVGLALHPEIRSAYGLEKSLLDAPPLYGGSNSIVSKLKKFFFYYIFEGHVSDNFTYASIARKYERSGRSPSIVFGPNYRNVDGEPIIGKFEEFNLRIMEQEAFELVKEVVIQHPRAVLEQVFWGKPILFSWYYLTCYLPFKYECGFWGGTNLTLTEPLSLLMIMISVVFICVLARQAPKGDVVRCSVLIFVTFMCSAIPILVGYPEPWLMGDAVLCLTMLELMIVVVAVRSILARVSTMINWKAAAAEPLI